MINFSRWMKFQDIRCGPDFMTGMVRRRRRMESVLPSIPWERPDVVKREIKEETGLDVSSFEGGFVFSYTRENPDEGDNYFVDIYCFTGDFTEADLHLQEAETDGCMLATAEEIKALGAQGKFLHYDSIKQVFS